MKTTLVKLKLDKNKIKECVKSLIKVNRELLKQNSIEGSIDDYIYLNIKPQQPLQSYEKIPV